MSCRLQSNDPGCILNTFLIQVYFVFSAPGKPKFLEHLINRVVSRKVGKQGANGLITASSESADLPEEPLSPDSEKCLLHAEAIVEELLACSARPPSGDSSDSGKGSLLESTSDFSPTTGHRKSWSTPASPTFQGIVKERLKSFQALHEASDTASVCSNPGAEPCSQKVYKNEEFEQELKEINKSIKKFYTAISNDESFNSAVMESGYVKALVAKINDKKLQPEETENGTEETDNGDSIDEVAEKCKLRIGDEDAGWNEWEQEVNDGLQNGDAHDEEIKPASRSSSRNSVNGVGHQSMTNTPTPSARTSSSSSISVPSRTNSVNNSRTNSTSESSESHVSRALRRFNQERNKSIPQSRLSAFSTNTPFSYSHIKSPPKLRNLRLNNGDSNSLNNKSSSNTNGATFAPNAKNRNCLSCDIENSSDQSAGQTGSIIDKRGCVSQSFDFGLLPLNPADLFDEHWSKCDLTFDDFDLDDTSKPKVRQHSMQCILVPYKSINYSVVTVCKGDVFS